MGQQTVGDLAWRSAHRSMLSILCGAAVLFGCAGGFAIPHFYSYIGVVVVAAAVNLWVILRTDPSLIGERVAPKEPGRDPHHRKLAALLMAVHFVIAGLDVGRFGWSAGLSWPGLAWPGIVAGQAGLGLSFAVAIWAIGANRFFSKSIRLQPERGHRVIDTGPYRFVRHPGYAAACVSCVVSGLGLGSWPAMLVAVPAIAVVVRRVRREERLLVPELLGYAEYAARVRFRILPGVW